MKLIRTPSLLLILSLLASVASCSGNADMKAAQAEIEKFHARFNQEQYDDIYAETSDEFKKASSQQDLSNLLSAIRQKLGNMKETKQVGFHVNYSTDGTLITLNHETTFERGNAKEQFILSMSDNRAKLHRYDIKSQDLIEK